MEEEKIKKASYFQEINLNEVVKKEIKINIDFDLDKTLDFIVEDIYKKYGFEGIAIFLLTKDKKNLKVFKFFIKENFLSKEAIRELLNMELPIDSPEGGMAAWVMHNKTHFFAKTIEPERLTVPLMIRIYELTKLKSNLFFPLEVYGEMLGIITFPSYTKVLDVSEDEIEEMKDYVRYISIAVSSSFLYQELRDAHLELADAYYELKTTKKLLDAKNRIMDNELEIARQIQMNLLPKSKPKTNKIDIGIIYQPLDRVGGDFYDFININRYEYGFFISDVSGHGVPAAFITSMIKMALSDLQFKKFEPNHAFAYLNEKIIGNTNLNFLTASYLIINFKEYKISYANAAHPPSFIVRENEELLELKTKGKIIGVFENIQFSASEIQIKPNDKIIMYTDGLVETVNKNNEMFGTDRLYKAAKNNYNLDINEFISKIYDELFDFKGTEVFKDDVAIIGIEVK